MASEAMDPTREFTSATSLGWHIYLLYSKSYLQVSVGVALIKEASLYSKWRPSQKLTTRHNN